MPDRHSLLIVIALTDIGMPALTAAWRAGPCPHPACSTWPMITCWTWSGLTPARPSAPLMASAPRSTALSEPRAPDILPNGVRDPATMTASVIVPPHVPARRSSPMRPGRSAEHLMTVSCIARRLQPIEGHGLPRPRHPTSEVPGTVPTYPVRVPPAAPHA